VSDSPPGAIFGRRGTLNSGWVDESGPLPRSRGARHQRKRTPHGSRDRSGSLHLAACFNPSSWVGEARPGARPAVPRPMAAGNDGRSKSYQWTCAAVPQVNGPRLAERLSGLGSVAISGTGYSGGPGRRIVPYQSRRHLGSAMRVGGKRYRGWRRDRQRRPGQEHRCPQAGGFTTNSGLFAVREPAQATSPYGIARSRCATYGAFAEGLSRSGIRKPERCVLPTL
jgi:hypothetical protein